MDEVGKSFEECWVALNKAFEGQTSKDASVPDCSSMDGKDLLMPVNRHNDWFLLEEVSDGSSSLVVGNIKVEVIFNVTSDSHQVLY